MPALILQILLATMGGSLGTAAGSKIAQLLGRYGLSAAGKGIGSKVAASGIGKVADKGIGALAGVADKSLPGFVASRVPRGIGDIGRTAASGIASVPGVLGGGLGGYAGFSLYNPNREPELSDAPLFVPLPTEIGGLESKKMYDQMAMQRTLESMGIDPMALQGVA